ITILVIGRTAGERSNPQIPLSGATPRFIMRPECDPIPKFTLFCGVANFGIQPHQQVFWNECGFGSEVHLGVTARWCGILSRHTRRTLMSDLPPGMRRQINESGGLSNDTRVLMLYEANKKTALVAYILWFFLGLFGAHNFYLERTGVAVAQ